MRIAPARRPTRTRSRRSCRPAARAAWRATASWWTPLDHPRSVAEDAGRLEGVARYVPGAGAPGSCSTLHARESRRAGHGPPRRSRASRRRGAPRAPRGDHERQPRRAALLPAPGFRLSAAPCRGGRRVPRALQAEIPSAGDLGIPLHDESSSRRSCTPGHLPPNAPAARVGVIAALAALTLAPPAAAATVDAGPLRAEVGSRLLVAAARERGGARRARAGQARLPHRRGDRSTHPRARSSRRDAGGHLATMTPAGAGWRSGSARRARGDGAPRRVTGPDAATRSQADRDRFARAPGERYLGFGERSNRVDQRGGEVENYVAEGPYEEDERPVIPLSCPPGASTHAPTRPTTPCPGCSPPPATACCVDDRETSYFRLDQGASGTWSVEVEAPRLDLRVFAARAPPTCCAASPSGPAGSPRSRRRSSSAPGTSPPAATSRPCSSG